MEQTAKTKTIKIVCIVLAAIVVATAIAAGMFVYFNSNTYRFRMSDFVGEYVSQSKLPSVDCPLLFSFVDMTNPDDDGNYCCRVKDGNPVIEYAKNITEENCQREEIDSLDVEIEKVVKKYAYWFNETCQVSEDKLTFGNFGEFVMAEDEIQDHFDEKNDTSPLRVWTAIADDGVRFICSLNAPVDKSKNYDRDKATIAIESKNILVTTSDGNTRLIKLFVDLIRKEDNFVVEPTDEKNILNALQPKSYYILPDGYMTFYMREKEPSECAFDVSGDNIDVWIDDILQSKIDGKFVLDIKSFKLYKITLHNKGEQVAVGKITSEYVNVLGGSHTIRAMESKVYKLELQGGFHLLTTQNDNIKIVKIYSADMSVIDHDINKSEYMIYSSDAECYYVILSNDSETDQEFTLIERRPTELMGSSQVVIEESQNFVLCRIVGTLDGDYNFELDFGELQRIPSIKLYRSDGNNKAYYVTKTGTQLKYQFSLANGEEVFVIFQRGSDMVGTITIAYELVS